MTEALTQRELEGVIDRTSNKFGGSLSIGGQWHPYSLEKYRGPWVEVTKGDHVKVLLNPWTKEDGDVKWYVKSIELLGDEPGPPPWEEEVEAPTAEQGAYLGRMTQQDSIARSVALKAAVDYYSGVAKTEETIVACAEYFLTFLRGEERGVSEGRIPYE